MINFNKHTLSNGLKLIHHYDGSTPMVVVNLLYNVGAKHESPNKTGFAHLFEHLMFGGSKNVTNFDTPIQLACGENNAFTNNDFTNYYEILPANNIETALWVESDRMRDLNINNKTLDIQRKVVCEEFKQRYLNQPYGDVWLKLRPLAYEKHPYSWPTIGKELSHIENATLQDVQEFYNRFYGPNNAILSIAGNISYEKTTELVEKWFGNIPSIKIHETFINSEPEQIEPKNLVYKSDVPHKAIYKAYHMPERLHSDYYTLDLISDILSGGNSGRLYNNLVKKTQIFSEVNAYITGDIEPGLFVIQGKLSPDISFEKANQSIENEIQALIDFKIQEKELMKVKNKAESLLVFSQIQLMNRALNLAYAELIGNINLVNNELDFYKKVDIENIQNSVKKYLSKTNCSTLYYEPTNE